MSSFQLPIFSQASGAREWRAAVSEPIAWEPDGAERRLGPSTDFNDGIYIVTVNEGTPVSWIQLAWKATIAAEGQHPGPGFAPGLNYDSAVAVRRNRVLGAITANIEWPLVFRWRMSLKGDGTAYSIDDLQSPETRGTSGIENIDRADRRFGPTIFTIWVHTANRKHGVGGALVRAIASHFGLDAGTIGYRLPISLEAVGMLSALGLRQIIGSF